jgi:hypothetical protein
MESVESDTMADDTNEPVIGAAQGGPPSLYTRIPTRVIWESKGTRGKGKGLTPGELRQFAMLCAYANNQGFAYPNQQTIADVANTDRGAVARMLIKAKRLGYIERVSVYRDHPAWRHVMGAVWRIIYDSRLTQDDLIDDLNKNDPAPIIEDDIAAAEPIPAASDTGKHGMERDGLALVDANALAHWFVHQVSATTGEVRIVNERAINDASQCLDIEGSKAAAIAALAKCRDQRRSAPPTMAAFKQPVARLNGRMDL